MPNILNASACPSIQQPTGFLSLAAAASAEIAPLAPDNISGNVNFASPLQQLALLIDLIQRGAGTNACAIVAGSNNTPGAELSLVNPGTGLTLTVRKGHGVIGGRVVLEADSGLVVPDNTARVWIWLQQTGALLALTTTAPPGTLSCLLGSCVTSGGNITSLDTSGVVYLQAGGLVRNSADPGIPTDTPPANLTSLVTATPFAHFHWTGAVHAQKFVPSVTSDPTSAAEGLQWFRSDTQQQKVWTSGAPVVIGSTAVATVAPVTVLTIAPASAFVWALPSALTEFNAAASNRVLTDLTNVISAQLMVAIPAPFSFGISPVFAVQYSTDQTTWHYLDGSSGPSLSSFAPGAVGSGFVAIASGAKGVVYLRVVGSGGDGSTTISVGSVMVQVK